MQEYFETAVRDDGTTYVRLVDANEEATGAPDWFRDAVYEAHDGEIPDDWRYDTLLDIVELIDDGEEDAFTIADGLTDTHTHDLLNWLSANVNRTAYSDLAADDFGSGDTLVDQIQAGQAYCIRQMAQVMLDAFQEHRNDELKVTDPD